MELKKSFQMYTLEYYAAGTLANIQIEEYVTIIGERWIYAESSARSDLSDDSWSDSS
jgi:hypothetical protein